MSDLRRLRGTQSSPLEENALRLSRHSKRCEPGCIMNDLLVAERTARCQRPQGPANVPATVTRCCTRECLVTAVGTEYTQAAGFVAGYRGTMVRWLHNDEAVRDFVLRAQSAVRDGVAALAGTEMCRNAVCALVGLARATLFSKIHGFAGRLDDGPAGRRYDPSRREAERACPKSADIVLFLQSLASAEAPPPSLRSDQQTTFCIFQLTQPRGLSLTMEHSNTNANE